MMLEVEMPIVESVQFALQHSKNKKVQKSLRATLERLETGDSFSNGLFQYPDVWDRTTVSLVWSGELSGTLSDHCLHASNLLEYKSDFIKRIGTALLYPIIVFILCASLISFLLFFIYPKIMPVFSSMHVALPLSTRIILSLQKFISSWGLYIFVGTVIVSILIWILKKKYIHVQEKLEEVALRVPIIGEMIRDYNLSLISRNIGTISASQLGLIQAVEITEVGTTQLWLKGFLKDLKVIIKEGKHISEYVRDKKHIPTIWQDLLFIGERTSKLSVMFIKISDIHQQEVSEKIITYTKLIEPLLMIITGLLVSFIALSIITPMYSLTQHVQ